MGYHAVLVAMALCGGFLAADGWSLAYAVAGAATATTVTPALAALLAPSGGHTFTWPFVLVSLVFLAAAPAFSRLRRVPARRGDRGASRRPPGTGRPSRRASRRTRPGCRRGRCGR
ncbi:MULTISPECIES: urea transporter [Streptomyces]|uniref:urea transporter n=1 Tax=Streptomyces TaxID=1883 RepID=UPI0022AA0044|nr:urea transporter [Streptomyces sp. 9-7]